MEQREPITSWAPVESGEISAQLRWLSPLDEPRLKQIITRLRRERDATPDPRRRGRIDWSIGQIYEDHLGDEAAALRWYQRAHLAHPEHLPTLLASRRIFTRAGRWGMTLRLLNQEISARRNPEHIAALSCLKAGVYLIHLHRPAEARACLRSALEANPRDETAARCLASVRREHPEPEGLAHAWRRAAENTLDPLLKEACAIEAAAAFKAAEAIHEAIATLEALPPSPRQGLALAPLYMEVGAHAEAMETALRLDPTRAESGWLAEQLAARLLEVDPARAAALLAGRAAPRCLLPKLDAQLAQGAYGEAAATAAQIAEGLTAPGDRALALWRQAELEVKGLDDDAALETLRALLEIEPEWPLVTRWAAKLYAQHPRLRLWTHEARLSVAPSKATRLGHLILIAWARRDLGDEEGQLSAYEAALAIAPRSDYARARLIERLVDQRRWSRLVGVLAREASPQANAYASQGALVSEALARAQALCTDDPEQALTVWVNLLKLDPSCALALEMSRGLARRLEEWPLLFKLNERALSLLGAGPEAAERRLTLWMSQAEILELEGQPTAAMSAYLTALEIQPLFAPARYRLQGLCLQTQDWAPLARAYRLALGVSEAPTRAALHALGDLCRETLKDAEGARFAFERALRVTPDHAPSLMALRALAVEAGNFAQEAALTEALLGCFEAPALRAALLCDLGHRCLSGDDLDGARAAWRRALEVEPGCGRARHALLGLRPAPEEIAWLAEREPLLEARVALWLDVARWSEDKALARQAVTRALEAAPDHVGALLHRERLAVEEGDVEALYEIYERLAQLTTTKESRWRFLLQKARLFGQREDFERVFDLRPDHPEILEMMARVAFEALDGDRLDRVHEARLAAAEHAEARLLCLMERGQLMRAVGLLDEAASSFERALIEVADDYATIEWLRESCEARGDTPAVKALAAHQARISAAAENASACFMEAGLLAERQDGGAALEAFMGALSRNPSDPSPMNAIRRLTQRQGDWRGWARALALEALVDADARASRALEIADIEAGRLNDPRAALRTLRHALNDPGRHAERLLQRIGDLCTEVGDWAGAAESYELLQVVTQDEALRQALTFRRAAIYAEKLDALPAAQSLLQGALEIQPTSPRLLEAMADLAARAGDHASAVAWLRRASPIEAGAEAREIKLARALMNAGVFEEGFARLRRAWMRHKDEALFDELGEFAARARRPDWLHEIFDAQPRFTPNSFLRFVELLWAAGVARRTIRAYLRINALGQKDQRARAFEALILSGTEDGLEEARAIYEALLDEHPAEIAYLQMLRRLYRRLGDARAAEKIQALLRALRRGQRGPLTDKVGLLQAAAPPPEPFDEEAWIDSEAPEPELALLAQVERAFPAAFQAIPAPLSPADEGFAEGFAELARCFEQPPGVGLDPTRPCEAPLPTEAGWVCSAELTRLPEGPARFLICAGLIAARWHLTALIRWSPAVLARRLAALLQASGRDIEALEAPPEAQAEQAERFAARVDFVGKDDLLDRLAEALPRLDLDALAVRAHTLTYRVGLAYAGDIGAALAALQAIGAEAARDEVIRFWLSPRFDRLALNRT